MSGWECGRAPPSQSGSAIERRWQRHVDQIFADPGAGGNSAVRIADDLTVTQDRVAQCEILKSDFVGLWDAFAGEDSARKFGARRNTIRMDDDGHVVPRMDADVHMLILLARLHSSGYVQKRTLGPTPSDVSMHLYNLQSQLSFNYVDSPRRTFPPVYLRRPCHCSF